MSQHVRMRCASVGSVTRNTLSVTGCEAEPRLSRYWRSELVMRIGSGSWSTPTRMSPRRTRRVVWWCLGAEPLARRPESAPSDAASASRCPGCPASGVRTATKYRARLRLPSLSWTRPHRAAGCLRAACVAVNSTPSMRVTAVSPPATDGPPTCQNRNVVAVPRARSRTSRASSTAGVLRGTHRPEIAISTSPTATPDRRDKSALILATTTRRPSVASFASWSSSQKVVVGRSSS
mmetsp:Transcript_1959/g.7554  ORF Transcript_1959/g.7554 Transcript_1959/m.7554 type:complete len:235 (+) Transcript_1959:546-1250(+)